MIKIIPFLSKQSKQNQKPINALVPYKELFKTKISDNTNGIPINAHQIIIKFNFLFIILLFIGYVHYTKTPLRML